MRSSWLVHEHSTGEVGYHMQIRSTRIYTSGISYCCFSIWLEDAGKENHCLHGTRKISWDPGKFVYSRAKNIPRDFYYADNSPHPTILHTIDDWPISHYCCGRFDLNPSTERHTRSYQLGVGDATGHRIVNLGEMINVPSAAVWSFDHRDNTDDTIYCFLNFIF